METLFVSEVAEIMGRGTAVFFEEDPVPWWPWRPHVVRVTKPDGQQFTTTAHVELARKVPPGEVMALMFPDLKPSQVPPGSKIDCIGGELQGNECGTYHRGTIKSYLFELT